MDIIANKQPQVIGHDWAVELLKRQAETERVPQAMLFTGPPNVGKGTLARFFAQYLNCAETTGQPCGRCRSCLKISSGNHPDIRIFDDEVQAIKIDEIRDLQREIFLSPYEGQYRVVVFCNFERATISAANALLKTLEEPPAQVVLMLTALDPGVLLPTIVSRCQAISLKSLPTQSVAEALQIHWHASAEQAELVSQLSAGRLGWAIRVLQDEDLLTRRQDSFQDLLDLLRMSRVERLAYAQSLSRNQAVIKEILLVWLTIWRDLLLLQSGCQTKVLNLDWHDQLERIAIRGTITQTKEMLHKTRTALKNLDYNVNPRLNLEVVLLKMPKYI